MQFHGFDAYDIEPGNVPDLFASRPIVVFGKWRGNATGTIEITGTTGRGPYQTSIAVSPAHVNDSHAALRYLWARHRIAELSDFGSGNLDQDSVATITSLGLTCSLLTKYTSFIAASAVAANAVRIAGAMWLAAHPLPRSVISTADAHRVEGIIVYFGGLLLLHHLVQRFDRERIAIPFAAYYFVTLALPVANGASLSDPAFAMHALVVAVLPPIIVATLRGVRILLSGAQSCNR